MSRHHKHKADTGDRFTKLKAMRAELAASYDLAETDPRIVQAAWLKLCQQNWETQILLGKPVPVGELQPFTDTIISLLGAKPTTLKIHWVYTCFKCRKESATDPESPPEPETAPPVKAVVAAPLAPATPAPPAPANVVALHKDIHAGARHN